MYACAFWCSNIMHRSQFVLQSVLSSRHRKLNHCILPDVLFSCVGRHAIVTLVTFVGPDKASDDYQNAIRGKTEICCHHRACSPSGQS